METEDFMPSPGEWHIHHNVTRAKGGSKSNIDNMKLVHSLCHINHHKEVNLHNDKD
jgi:hypothetical protein